MDEPIIKQSTPVRTINVGSRKSQLALIQTDNVIDKLTEFYENNPVELNETKPPPKFHVVTMTTIGDEIINKPLSAIGSKSLFTGDLEKALLENKIDFIVHSLKDLSTTLPEGCTIGAILKRHDPEDVIILNKLLRNKIDPLSLLCSTSNQKETINIGTSSQRRIAMIKSLNISVNCIDIRGNLNTRLAKLDDDNNLYSGLILAKAGIDRMGWSHLIGSKLSPETNEAFGNWCYAVGQGAIAVECRSDDMETLNFLSKIVDLKTTYEAIAERCMMKKLDGGCSVPLGTRSRWKTEGESQLLSLTGVVLSLDGSKIVTATDSIRIESESLKNVEGKARSHIFETGISLAIPDEQNSKIKQNAMNCSKLGYTVAQKLIDGGCLELIESARIKNQ